MSTELSKILLVAGLIVLALSNLYVMMKPDKLSDAKKLKLHGVVDLLAVLAVAYGAYTEMNKK